MAFMGTLSPTFVNNEMARGGGTWGLSLKVGVPPDAEGEDTTTSPTLCLLKTRLVHVSSSSVSTATTPFCLSSAGAGSIGWGAKVAEIEGALGVEVPTPAAAALRLASR